MDLSRNSSRRGAFFVFEGIDRSGKSTQCNLLAERLAKDGHKVERVRFPDRKTPVGKVLDDFLKGGNDSHLNPQCLHLLFSANRWEIMPKIEKWLQQGICVICDRYSFSGLSYSISAANFLACQKHDRLVAELAASVGCSNDQNSKKHNLYPPRPPLLDIVFCKATEKGLVRPDAVFYIDLPPQVAEKRGDYGMEVYERKEMQEGIYKAYETFQDLKYWKKISGIEESSDIEKSDQPRDIFSIHQEIHSHAKMILEEIEKEGVEYGRLWE